ncbi:phosphoenolpyruvate-utilizing N-terminal domain-containing protein [Photobacterium alginatilyticum]|uniref:phosphoenolpyruvate-utilizing N-terminal domain-containing protein n=1 Tax=Photobacterium alginatilyticum TaxID=1775171 RepID=UPI004068845F
MLAGITTLNENTYNQTTAYHEQHLLIPRYRIEQEKFETEMIRFYRARDSVQYQLEQLRDQTAVNNGLRQAQRFTLSIQLLTSHEIEIAINDAVANGQNIEAAALDVLSTYSELTITLGVNKWSLQQKHIKELCHTLLWHLMST